MRDITATEVEELMKKFPKARRIAVSNFLMTGSANRSVMYANMNLAQDAKVYAWNSDTVKAIKTGISMSEKSP